MSFKSDRALDGYSFDGVQTSFISPWIDIHSSPYFTIKTIFNTAATTTDGYLTLEMSSDRQGTSTTGAVCPLSALTAGSFGNAFGVFGDPLDLTTYPGSSIQVINGLVNGSNIVSYILPGTACARWFRVKFLGTNGALTNNVSVFYTWKSTS